MTKGQPSAYKNPGSLISTEELAKIIDSPNVRVVEAAFDMPGSKPPLALERFREAHIPRAIFFDIDAICDKASSLPHMIPSAEEFGRDVGNLGISSDDRVIVYDRDGFKFAPRVWWELRTFGHKTVSILDGGFAKWQSEGRSVERGITKKEPRTFKATLSARSVRSKADVLKILDNKDEQLIDARSKGRFDGSSPESWPGRRSGHIPGSLNLPYDQIVDPRTHALLPEGELRQRFQHAGLELNKPVVTSCGSGVTACALAFALHLLGKQDVAVYDGSWAEWGLPGETPVATSRQP